MTLSNLRVRKFVVNVQRKSEKLKLHIIIFGSVFTDPISVYLMIDTVSIIEFSSVSNVLTVSLSPETLSTE